jgi:hypothetical protein
MRRRTGYDEPPLKKVARVDCDHPNEVGWICELCCVENLETRVVCYVCHEGIRPGFWRCPKCTLVNAEHILLCTPDGDCKTVKPGMWQCGCTVVNSAAHAMCETCGKPANLGEPRDASADQVDPLFPCWQFREIADDDEHTIDPVDQQSLEWQTVTDIIRRPGALTGHPAARKANSQFAKEIGRFRHPVLNLEIHRTLLKRFKNQKFLWHGTQEANFESIVKNGFDRSYCGKNGTAFGRGVYFARDIEYSLGYGGKQVILASCVLGSKMELGAGVKLPRDHYCITTGDSADTEKASIFVLYKDFQALPLYLITF